MAARDRERRARFSKGPIFELGALAALGLSAFWAIEVSTSAWLERAETLDAARSPDGAAAREAAREAALLFAGGAVLLAIGRALSLARARAPIASPLLLPAVTAACLLGAVLHAGTVELVGDRLRAPTVDRFASGYFIGCVAGAAVLALPRDPIALASRIKALILAGMAILFALLAIYGSGPGASDARVNLGPFQPTEIIKAAFVIFLAVYLGERAAKLRWQRAKVAGLRFPRPVLLFPAAAVLVLVFSTLFALRDLGPTLILAPVFIGLFYAASRASGFALAALTALGAGVIALAAEPALAGPGLVGTRVQMWLDPWENALSHGHQLAESLWAVAAGGGLGQGLAQNHAAVPPAAKTDLILALLVEQLGTAGLALYLALLAAIAGSILAVAAKSRTPERGLAAAGIALLFVSQWAVIHAGTFGALPLSGVVVPFLSTGRSSLIVFVVLAALAARLAEEGRPRAASAELEELAGGVRVLGWFLALALAVGAGLAGHRAHVAAEDASARGVLVELGDGTLRLRQNPRLWALAREIPRGSIEDRRGEAIAEGGVAGDLSERRYPLGPALGTLVGLPPGSECLPWWSLERRFDELLRGYPERDESPARREGCRGLEPLPSPDFRDLAPLLRLPGDERAAALEDRVGEAEERAVRTTLDARLQRESYEILRGAAEAPSGAAAAAVIDVDTGEILARAQAPDYDPGDPRWRARHRDSDPEFFGAYGPLADKTGLRGTYQAGSAAKVYTALAAARAGWATEGAGCRSAGGPALSCAEADERGRPSFALPGWREPIRDFPGEPVHGELEASRALAVSCNVYFGKLALALGPEPLAELAEAGLEIGPYDAEGRTRIRPGRPESRRLAETGIGQGGAWMNAVQGARLAAAVGAGGVYRRCPPSMEKGAACEEIELVADAADVEPILAGMRAAMGPGGTGSALAEPEGVRVYGKTGTAQSPGFAGEEPHGIERGGEAPPHAWFIAVAEDARAAQCGPTEPGRLAVAVVIPRGGSGAGAAGPPAMEILGAAAELGYLGIAGEGR